MADSIPGKYCMTCACLVLAPGNELGKAHVARLDEPLCHNNPLHDVELRTVREIAEHTHAIVEDLNEKVYQARGLLRTLDTALDLALFYHEAATSILMRSIPNEVLANIFDQYVSNPPYQIFGDIVDPKQGVWLLTQVSHRWRELAINSPRLWTHLVLNFNQLEGRVTPSQYADRVALFLARSRGLPLTVHLRSPLEPEVDFKNHPVLPVLETSIPRWRHLDVELPLSDVQCFSGNSFSALRSLILQESLLDILDEHETVQVDTFHWIDAPVLQALTLCPGDDWSRLQHIAIPWSRLTSLVRFPVFDAGAFNTLRSLTNLESFTVDLSPTYYPYTPIQDIITFPKLLRLGVLREKETGGSKEFISALNIPALSELELSYDHQSLLHFPTSPILLEGLISLDIHCEMNARAENTQYLLDFLTLTYRVEFLRLHDLTITVELADALTVDTDASRVMLPCLRHLDIGRCVFSAMLDDDIGRLLEMFCSRLPPVSAERKQERAPGTTLAQDYQGRCLSRLQIGSNLFWWMDEAAPSVFQRLASQLQLDFVWNWRGDFKCGDISVST